MGRKAQEDPPCAHNEPMCMALCSHILDSPSGEQVKDDCGRLNSTGKGMLQGFTIGLWTSLAVTFDQPCYMNEPP